MLQKNILTPLFIIIKMKYYFSTIIKSEVTPSSHIQTFYPSTFSVLYNKDVYPTSSIDDPLPLLLLYLNHIMIYKTYRSHTLCVFILLILWFIYIYVHFYVFIYYYYYYHDLVVIYIFFYKALYHRHSMLTIQLCHIKRTGPFFPGIVHVPFPQYSKGNKVKVMVYSLVSG